MTLREKMISLIRNISKYDVTPEQIADAILALPEIRKPDWDYVNAQLTAQIGQLEAEVEGLRVIAKKCRAEAHDKYIARLQADVGTLKQQVREYKWEWECACERDRNEQAEVERLKRQIKTARDFVVLAADALSGSVDSAPNPSAQKTTELE